MVVVRTPDLQTNPDFIEFMKSFLLENSPVQC